MAFSPCIVNQSRRRIVKGRNRLPVAAAAHNLDRVSTILLDFGEPRGNPGLSLAVPYARRAANLEQWFFGIDAGLRRRTILASRSAKP